MKTRNAVGGFALAGAAAYGHAKDRGERQVLGELNSAIIAGGGEPVVGNIATRTSALVMLFLLPPFAGFAVDKRTGFQVAALITTPLGVCAAAFGTAAQTDSVIGNRFFFLLAEVGIIAALAIPVGWLVSSFVIGSGVRRRNENLLREAAARYEETYGVAPYGGPQGVEHPLPFPPMR